MAPWLLLSVGHHSLSQLVLNLYLCVLAMMMLLLEVRIEGTRRIALHLLRYAAVMMHPTARGVLYLLVSLTLLTQSDPVLWIMGYAVEAVGIMHVVLGSRVASKMAALRRKLTDNRSIRQAFRAVSPDDRPISGFGARRGTGLERGAGYERATAAADWHLLLVMPCGRGRPEAGRAIGRREAQVARGPAGAHRRLRP